MGQVLLARSNGTLHTQFKADLAYTVCILAGTWRPLLGRLTVVACVSQTLFSTCWHDSLLPMGTQDAPPVNRAANQRAGKRQALCMGIAGRLIIIRSAGRRMCAGDCHAAPSPAPGCRPSAQVLPTSPLALLADRSAHPPGGPPRPPSGRPPHPPSWPEAPATLCSIAPPTLLPTALVPVVFLSASPPSHAFSPARTGAGGSHSTTGRTTFAVAGLVVVAIGWGSTLAQCG